MCDDISGEVLIKDTNSWAGQLLELVFWVGFGDNVSDAQLGESVAVGGELTEGLTVDGVLPAEDVSERDEAEIGTET